MTRYTIKASYTTNDVGARICPEEDQQGEWVKAEELEAEIERLKNDLDVYRKALGISAFNEVSLKKELEALKSWRNDWENVELGQYMVVKFPKRHMLYGHFRIQFFNNESERRMMIASDYTFKIID